MEGVGKRNQSNRKFWVVELKDCWIGRGHRCQDSTNMETTGKTRVRSVFQINRDLVLPGQVFPDSWRFFLVAEAPLMWCVLTSLCFLVYFHRGKRGGEQSDNISSESWKVSGRTGSAWPSPTPFLFLHMSSARMNGWRQNPQTPEFIYGQLNIYSYIFKLLAPSKYSPCDAIHL